MAPRAPNRAVAAILAFFLSPGAAHAYLGLPRRGAVWLALCLAAPLIAAAMLPSIAGVVGYGVALPLVGIAFGLAWLGPTIDVLNLPRARFGTARWPELAAFAVVGLGLMVADRMAVRFFLLEAFNIPSGGMWPSLKIGDHIFADKVVYRRRMPRRGEMMVFAFPEHPEQDFVKRVIAMPGDKLEAQNGHPIINGWQVPSCRVGEGSYQDEDSPVAHHEGDVYVEFLGDQSYLTFYDRAAGAFPEYQGPFFVKPGEVWVMGDDRNNSHDSRMWFGGQGGGVPIQLFRGRAITIWMSERAGALDWSRTQQALDGPRLDDSMASLRAGLDACLRTKPAQTTPPNEVP